MRGSRNKVAGPVWTLFFGFPLPRSGAGSGSRSASGSSIFRQEEVPAGPRPFDLTVRRAGGATASFLALSGLFSTGAQHLRYTGGAV